ncbi:MAG: ABC transporter ATP-binding protein [Planctomycetes bacterium]|nr:ABC transporter ATP-binding protein [Planctomycetota bacterium]
MTTSSSSSKQTPPERNALVRMIDVHKSFGDLVVLDGLELELRRGETTVIIGESGSGKSVILNHIVRLLRPDRGEVHYDGVRIDNLSERKLAGIRSRFGFLFQLSALFDSLTVGDNVAFPIRQHTKLSRAKVAEVVSRKLTMVGLDGIQSKRPAELSGGQKKRVALARAIALDPELILYDEPTTGLDPPRADVINELIIKLKRELGVTSVVVTHDMASANKVADRVLMLYGGKFIFDGTPKSMAASDDPRVRQFIEGRATDEDMASLRGDGHVPIGGNRQ